jgi:hypothetical protein
MPIPSSQGILARSFAPVSALAFVAAVGLGATLAPATASAQQIVIGPSAEFIATTEPVYYEGHAAYWYNNHWYWKDEHGGWQHYESEPRELQDRRLHSPPPRHYYAKPAPRPGPSPHPGPEPHGGGRR